MGYKSHYTHSNVLFCAGKMAPKTIVLYSEHTYVCATLCRQDTRKIIVLYLKHTLCAALCRQDSAPNIIVLYLKHTCTYVYTYLLLYVDKMVSKSSYYIFEAYLHICSTYIRIHHKSSYYYVLLTAYLYMCCSMQVCT